MGKNGKSQEEISNLSYEQSIESLDSIIKKLESGELSLKNSIKEWEKGSLIANHAKKLLDDAKNCVSKNIEKNLE